MKFYSQSYIEISPRAPESPQARLSPGVKSQSCSTALQFNMPFMTNKPSIFIKLGTRRQEHTLHTFDVVFLSCRSDRNESEQPRSFSTQIGVASALQTISSFTGSQHIVRPWR